MANVFSYFNVGQNTRPFMLPDYYKLLEIGNDASDMEIKRAYRRKVKELHPSRNPTPEAVEQFNLINEAYEILIHHNTRELYEEDFQSWHNPEEYPIYKYWVDAARSRAREHSKLSWEEFTKTKFYKSTRSFNHTIFVIGLILGIFIAVSPYLVMIMTEKKFLGVIAIFIALPIGGFMIVQALVGFQSLKKFH